MILLEPVLKCFYRLTNIEVRQFTDRGNTGGLLYKGTIKGLPGDLDDLVVKSIWPEHNNLYIVVW